MYLAASATSHLARAKVIGQSQRSKSNIWLAAVNIRGSTLPSAAKSRKSQLPV